MLKKWRSTERTKTLLTMASSSVRSVFVRSVDRHFLSISQPRQILHSPLHWHDYKDLSGRVVKPSQMIVKSCKRRPPAAQYRRGTKTIALTRRLNKDLSTLLVG